MTIASEKLVSSIANFLSKMEGQTASGGVPLIFESNVPLDPDSVLTYDIKTLFENHARYDLRSSDVVVLVKDTSTSSPTHNFYFNSETVITKSIDENGIVKIHNASDTFKFICIRVSAPSIIK